MYRFIIVLTATAVSMPKKLMMLGGMVIFVCLLYLILPKLMNRRIRGYHEECELDEEQQDSKSQAETANDIEQESEERHEI